MEQKNPIHKSFGFAFKGISVVLRERNFRIQILVSVAVIVAGFFYSISSLEWVSICLCIAAVLCLEMINTAIEKSIDLLHPDWNEKAGKIKDISAGAVLIATIASLVVAAIIFIPKILVKCC